MTIVCVATLLDFIVGLTSAMEAGSQFSQIALGGLLMTCTVGPAATGIVLDVVHPGVRCADAAMLSLFHNPFGLAMGPFVGGQQLMLWDCRRPLP